jgi:hypothetical protein
LALDDDQRAAFVCHLHGVGVAQLVWGEAAAHAGSGGGSTQARAGRRVRPVSSASRSGDNAEQRADPQFQACREPRLRLLPAPRVHPHLAAPSSLAVANDQRPAARVEVGLSERKRFLDPYAGSPKDHDQSSEPLAVRPRASRAHDGDDFLDGRRIGRIGTNPSLRSVTKAALRPTRAHYRSCLNPALVPSSEAG